MVDPFFSGCSILISSFRWQFLSDSSGDSCRLYLRTLERVSYECSSRGVVDSCPSEALSDEYNTDLGFDLQNGIASQFEALSVCFESDAFMFNPRSGRFGILVVRFKSGVLSTPGRQGSIGWSIWSDGESRAQKEYKPLSSLVAFRLLLFLPD